MEALRATVGTMTSSFRYPMFMVSYQPTFAIPPPSTIYGMLSAAKGEKVGPEDVRIGYDFEYEGNGTDLERLHIYGEDNPPRFLRTDIVLREFLYECTLHLYLSDLEFKDYLKYPYYTLLLGRQSDLAHVRKLDRVTLEPKEEVEIKNTIVPFKGQVSGQVVSLPTDFTTDVYRSPIDVKPYCLITTPQRIINGYTDSERGVGVYMHEGKN